MEQLELTQASCRLIAEYLLRRNTHLDGEVLDRRRQAGGQTDFRGQYEIMLEDRLPYSSETCLLLWYLNAIPCDQLNGVRDLRNRSNSLRRLRGLCEEYLHGLTQVEYYLDRVHRIGGSQGTPRLDCALPAEEQNRRYTTICSFLDEITQTELSVEQLEENIISLHRIMECGDLRFEFGSGSYRSNLRRICRNMECRQMLRLSEEI